jgi:predicted PurR-regulated permease PerM
MCLHSIPVHRTGIIVPFIFATLAAVLLSPLVENLQRIKIHRTISIAIAILISLLLVASLVYVVASQVSMLSETFPKMRSQAEELLNPSNTMAVGEDWRQPKADHSMDCQRARPGHEWK